MKKTAYLFAFILTVFMVANSYASIQLSTMPLTKFVRSTGEPKTETKTFSGIAGPAIIKLINGDLTDTTIERVSSSAIEVNGNLVFGPSDFSQNVITLEKNINLIDGINSLTVDLKGKPGGTVSIQIIQILDNINIDPSRIVLQEEGATSQITLTGKLSNGRVVNITGPSFGTTYTSLSPGVATVSPSGLVTAVANGDTNIWITNGSFGANLPVTVQITHSTRTVGQEGGTLKFHNGLVLEIPPGAVPGSTQILIKDLPLDQVTAILSNPLLSSNHTKRLLGGFTAEPDGLVFNQPVMATVPVLPLNPYEMPAQIEIFLSEQRYRYVTSQFEYWGNQGVAKVNIQHFSAHGIVGVTNVDCNDSPTPPPICTELPCENPIVLQWEVDFQNDLCELQAWTQKGFCPGSPTLTYSGVDQNTCNNIDMKMTIEPDLHSVAVGKQAEFKAFVTGTWNTGPLQGHIAFSHDQINPIWSSDAPNIADFVGQTGLIEGIQSNPDPVKVWAKVSESLPNLNDYALVRVGDYIEIRPPGDHLCPGEQPIFEAWLRNSADDVVGPIEVTWSSNNTPVAFCNSSFGFTTIITAGNVEGTATITATSETEGLSPQSVQVTVNWESAKIHIASYHNGDKAYTSGANLVGTVAECGTRRVTKLTVSTDSFVGSVDVSADGKFAIPVPLDWGINHLRFSTYDSDGHKIPNNMDGVDYILRRVPHCLKSDSTLQLPINLYGTPVTYTSLRPLIASVDPVTGVVTGHANGWAPITTEWQGYTIARWIGVSTETNYVFTHEDAPFYEPMDVPLPLPDPGSIFLPLGLPGGTTVYPTAVNDLGQVAGWLRYTVEAPESPTGYVNIIRGFVFKAPGPATVVSYPWAYITYLNDINNVGNVVGYALDMTGFVYHTGSNTFTNISFIPYQINDSNKIVGIGYPGAPGDVWSYKGGNYEPVAYGNFYGAFVNESGKVYAVYESSPDEFSSVLLTRCAPEN